MTRGGGRDALQRSGMWEDERQREMARLAAH